MTQSDMEFNEFEVFEGYTPPTREELIQGFSEAFGEEVGLLLVEYQEKFGSNYPTYPARDPEIMVKELKDCIKRGNDVIELGYYSLDEDILY